MGQRVSEALFVRSMLLEFKLVKKVSVITHTDSTAGKINGDQIWYWQEDQACGTEVPVRAKSCANGPTEFG